jgi:ubiquinone/menaquinone biosynthesis C-methylase UbiE
MTAITPVGPPARAGEELTISDSPDGPALDPQQVYALGAGTDEQARLIRQSDELRPEAEALLARIGLRPGDAALDVGCGPRGILGLLAAAVSPGGRVVGLDADPGHVAAATGYARSGPGNIQVIRGDARRTGLPAGSFDLVHARTLLVTIPEPAEVLTEMVRLARPGGWVASQEPDVEHALCYPPLPAWDRRWEIFRAAFTRAGADLHTGRRLTEMYRQAGLVDIQVQVHAGAYPAGHSRRTLIPDLVRSLRPVIAELGVASDAELEEVDLAVRRHLARADTLMMPHLLVAAWGRKPERQNA